MLQGWILLHGVTLLQVICLLHTSLNALCAHNPPHPPPSPPHPRMPHPPPPMLLLAPAVVVVQ